MNDDIKDHFQVMTEERFDRCPACWWQTNFYRGEDDGD